MVGRHPVSHMITSYQDDIDVTESLSEALEHIVDENWRGIAVDAANGCCVVRDRCFSSPIACDAVCVL